MTRCCPHRRSYPSADSKPLLADERSDSKSLRPLARRRESNIVPLALLVTLLGGTALMVGTAPRPKLRIRQLLQPLQWVMIGSSSYHPQGYEVVAIPSTILTKLRTLVANGHSRVTYGSPGEPLEDPIIFGQTERVLMPSALQAELRETFRPLVSSFCACELEERATVGGGGVRIYKHGATLAAHLDWAHKFVVSATLNVQQLGNHSSWPLHMQAVGRAAHQVTHGEGEAVLYEGSRMLHSRPLPLRDDQYAAAFVGFVPKKYPAGRGWLPWLYVTIVRTFS